MVDSSGFSSVTKTKKTDPIKEDKIPQSSDSTNSVGGTPKVISDKGYKFEKEIGVGGFSKVYKARDKDNRVMACKRFDLTTEGLQEWKDKCLKQEMQLMTRLSKNKHPNVIQTYDAIKTRRQAFIFMQFAENGSIQDYLEKNKQPIEENQCKQWFRQIASAIKFLHGQGVAHRDLKPENFLLDNNYQTVLVTDFGFSAISMANDEIFKGTQCGTDDYKAPEILNLAKGHVYDAKKVDMWALGVSLYEMLHYDRPFPSNTNKKTRLELMKKKLYVKSAKPVHLSGEAEHCWNKLMEFDPKIRLTAQQLVAHPWLK